MHCCLWREKKEGSKSWIINQEAFINLHINPCMLVVFNWAKMEQYIMGRKNIFTNWAKSVKIKLELNISDVLHCFAYVYMLQDGMPKNEGSLVAFDSRFFNEENLRGSGT